MKIVIPCIAIMLFGSSACLADSFLKPRPEKRENNTVESERAQTKEEARAKEDLEFVLPELTFEKQIELPYTAKNTQDLCKADISLSYSQADTAVRVKTDISVVDGVAECPDARGEYLIRVRSLGSNGETRTQEFNESWQLSAGRSVTQGHTYDLQADPDLLWVRIRSSRNTQCVCKPADGSVPALVNQPASTPKA